MALLDLSGESALIVGGGAVALRRARLLLDAGMTVRVVAPQVGAELLALPVVAEVRPYRPSDLCGVRLVVAATDDAALNSQICAEARAAGVLVNQAGQAEQGTLRFPAVAARGAVQVAVSSGGELPLLARALARHFAAQLPAEPQVTAWQRAREAALRLPETERAAALSRLSTDIQNALAGAA